MKTASRRDVVDLPEVVRADLQALVPELEPAECLFKGTVQHFQPGGKRANTAAAHNRTWFNVLSGISRIERG